MLTMPLLEGLDGVRKMSKSLGQLRGAHRAARRAVRQADVDPRRADREVPAAVHADRPAPRSTEVRARPGRRLAASERAEARAWRATIVDLYHGAGAGARAEARFDAVHRQHEIPDDVPEVADPRRRGARTAGLAAAPARGRSGSPSSNGEARRCVAGRGGAARRRARSTTPTPSSTLDALRGKVLSVGRRALRAARLSAELTVPARLLPCAVGAQLFRVLCHARVAWAVVSHLEN